MTEIRCVKCKRLLMKGLIKVIQIKCPKCGYLNHLIGRGNSISFYPTEPMYISKDGKTYTGKELPVKDWLNNLRAIR